MHFWLQLHVSREERKHIESLMNLVHRVNLKDWRGFAAATLCVVGVYYDAKTEIADVTLQPMTTDARSMLGPGVDFTAYFGREAPPSLYAAGLDIGNDGRKVLY